MKYAIISAVTVLTVICEYIYCSYMGVFKSKFNIKQSERYKDGETVPYSGALLILIMIVCAAISFAAQLFLLNKPISFYTVLKIYILFVLVFAAAVIDSKKKIIPNVLIIFGFCFRACVYVYEFFKAENFKDIVRSDMIGFAIGFGLIALVSVITKQGIGFGDAKLFGIIGIVGGMASVLSTLFISLIVSSVASIAFLISHKKDRKGTFPFGPCIMIGYVITMFVSNY